jgi:hypothetical protein
MHKVIKLTNQYLNVENHGSISLEYAKMNNTHPQQLKRAYKTFLMAIEDAFHRS